MQLDAFWAFAYANIEAGIRLTKCVPKVDSIVVAVNGAPYITAVEDQDTVEGVALYTLIPRLELDAE